MIDHDFESRRRAAAASVTLLLMMLLPLPAAAQTPPANVQPPAVIGVSPGKIEMEIGNRPVVQSLRLYNLGDEDVDVVVAVNNWDLDTDNKVRPIEPTEQSLDQWMIINPLSFTIPANGSQTVRFAVRPRVKPEAGEHRAMIYFEQVRPEGGNPADIFVNFKLGVAVYAFAGDTRRIGALETVEVLSDDRFISALFGIRSDGNAHVRLMGQYAIFPAAGFPGVADLEPIADVDQPEVVLPDGVVGAGPLPNVPILAGTVRQVPVVLEHRLVPGQYVFATLGDISGAEFREAVNFTVPARPDPSVAGEQQPR